MHRADLIGELPKGDGITVEYPKEGSLFPADFAAPLFQWRDVTPEAMVWRVEVKFAGHGPLAGRCRLGRWMTRSQDTYLQP
jgi:hypothetical protein